MNTDVKAKLQAPFEADEIEWRVGNTTQDKTKGMALAYVTNRAIQNRLDDVFGPFGWQNVFREWGDKGQLCGISVKDPNAGEWITKWDGADNTNFEPTKGGLSDSMKRAAYQWGIGRYLYKLDAVWVPIKQQGKSYVIERGNEPRLPVWALPEGSKQRRPPAPPADHPPLPDQEPPKDTATKERTHAAAPGMLTKAQMQELVDMSVKQWGAKDAGANFAEYTGYKQPSEVPAAEFEKVKQIINDSLPF